MTRITRAQMFMEMAHTVAKRATCFRLNVGAVMVHQGSVVSIGYNGAPSGAPHCMGEACPGWTTSCTRSLHAEENALDRLPPGYENIQLYLTHSPCRSCYHRLVQDGRVNKVFFGNPFRDTAHLESCSGIELYRVLPSGQVIEWTTGRIVNEV